MSDREIRVAVDIGSKKHHVAIGSSDGRVLEEFAITHDKAGFDSFFRHIGAQEQATPLPVVVVEALGPGLLSAVKALGDLRGVELETGTWYSCEF